MNEQKYTISKAVVLDTVDNGKITDKILVYGEDKEIKIVSSDPFSFKLKGEYKNNDEAIANGLSIGDYYTIPISSNDQASYIAVVKKTSPSLRLFFDDIDSRMSFLGIADKNSVENWNTFFANRQSMNWYTIVLTSVRVSGNSILLNIDYTSPLIDLKEMQLINLEINNLDTISELNLAKNQLSNIPASILALANLTSLNLSENLFTNFDYILPPKLTSLNLSTNKIVSFDPSNPLPQELINLDLYQNQLAAFDPINHPLPSTLQTLLLRQNNLNVFDPVNYPLPPNLQYLFLDYNNLAVFDPVNFALPNGLLWLILDYNKLTVFDPINFTLPNSITFLGLGNNRLTSFNPTNALPSNLNYLHMDNNQISSFDPVHALPSGLTSLALQSNNLSIFNPKNHLLPNTINSLLIGQNIQITTIDLPWPTSLETLAISNLGITSFDPINALPEGLLYLNISTNEYMPVFNPVNHSLPKTLKTIFLLSHYLTLESLNNETDWISSLPDNGQLYVLYGANSITDTTTETLFLAKNWTII
ncbi:hypothetical protein [uncultured Flavobacterium sp.]|uniref:hypothetical protein n=1 Tax=uncultured Flavobacterium sp. TaxID=165435 RepID=UPI00308167F7